MANYPINVLKLADKDMNHLMFPHHKDKLNLKWIYIYYLFS